MKKFLFSTICLSACLSGFANTDKKEILNGVQLESSKEDSVRTYTAKFEKKIPFSLELIKKGITNFTNSCNNSLKHKRKYTSPEAECKHNNENIVETFIVSNINPNEELKSYQEHYLLGKQVYNRGSYEFYELVTVKEEINSQGQKKVTIVGKMLNDEEVKLYTVPQFSQDTNFHSRTTVTTLTELNKQETLLQYEYTADTTHWLLNKELSVPQVFSYISNGIDHFVDNIEQEAQGHKRDIASK